MTLNHIVLKSPPPKRQKLKYIYLYIYIPIWRWNLFKLIYKHKFCKIVITTTWMENHFIQLYFTKKHKTIYQIKWRYDPRTCWTILSNCLMNLKNFDTTGLEPMTSAMPVQCSNQLSYEITQLRGHNRRGRRFESRRVTQKIFQVHETIA